MLEQEPESALLFYTAVMRRRSWTFVEEVESLSDFSERARRYFIEMRPPMSRGRLSAPRLLLDWSTKTKVDRCRAQYRRLHYHSQNRSWRYG